MSSGSTTIYIVETDKTVATATADLERAVKAHGFGVLHAYDLQATLQSKGQTLAHQCRILEVCNPQQAASVLSVDMDLSLALPCRIAVFDAAGQTRIGMLLPTAQLGLLSKDRVLHRIGGEVDAALRLMIDEAAREAG